MRSYRPISLLNVDLKILPKILAQCLQQILPITATDQTGFLLGRRSFHNTRRLLNISSPSWDGPEVIVSLDAEKPFDRVEWTFLFFCSSKIWVQFRIPILDKVALRGPGCFSPHKQAPVCSISPFGRLKLYFVLNGGRL